MAVVEDRRCRAVPARAPVRPRAPRDRARDRPRGGARSRPRRARALAVDRRAVEIGQRAQAGGVLAGIEACARRVAVGVDDVAVELACAPSWPPAAGPS